MEKGHGCWIPLAPSSMQDMKPSHHEIRQGDCLAACELTAGGVTTRQATWTYQLLAPGTARTRPNAVLARPHLDLGALHGKGWKDKKTELVGGAVGGVQTPNTRHPCWPEPALPLKPMLGALQRPSKALLSFSWAG